MTHTLVSIIVPTKNSQRTLESCLLSLKNQTYPSLEIIVVDNFSSDTTQSIAAPLATFFYEQGPERSAQRNYGAKHAHGKYIAFIDSDMRLSPQVIESCVKKMENNHSIRGVIIPEESFGKGFWAQCKKLERSFYVGVDWIEAARFFYREDFLHVGGYDERLVSGEDWDLSQKIEHLGRFEHIHEYIFHDEGNLKLWTTIRKKFFYATEFTKYLDLNKKNSRIFQQIDIFKRYKLFFSKPKKFFKHPVLFCGMIFMKSCEFFFGAIGYLKTKSKIR